MRALLCPLAIVAASAVPSQERVRAQDYDAFWLWACVRARPEVETAKTVYLLQGEIGPGTRDGAIRMKAQGGGGPGPHTAALWLVYRVRSLDWPPEIVAEIGRRAIPEGVRRLREYVKRSGDLIEFRFKNSLAKAAKPHKRSLGT